MRVLKHTILAVNKICIIHHTIYFVFLYIKSFLAISFYKKDTPFKKIYKNSILAVIYLNKLQNLIKKIYYLYSILLLILPKSEPGQLQKN